MRLKKNDTFSLFNKTGEWEAKILNITKDFVEFKSTKQLRQKENVQELWLAFSPIKSNYQNFMIQKATELGVSKFLPIIFDRTIVRKIKKDRLEKIVIEACEQSNRISVPAIEQVQNLKSFLNSNPMNLIFTDLNSDNKKIDKKKSKYDTLMAGFPAGTVSGAPKIRAMEIIDELEKARPNYSFITEENVILKNKDQNRL